MVVGHSDITERLLRLMMTAQLQDDAVTVKMPRQCTCEPTLLPPESMPTCTANRTRHDPTGESVRLFQDFKNGLMR